MNYRHAYHAGNIADVLKHATLALVLDHMRRKPAPFRYVDTHAGPGLYDLVGPEAAKTGEWQTGIARLVDAPLPADLALLMAPYLSTVEANNRAPLSAATLTTYPGSPEIARHLLRPDDKLILNELHDDDNDRLVALAIGDRRTKVLSVDGYQALRAALPPPERRGVVLVDPPFEEPGELSRLVQALKDADRRFATGVVMLWYPIKDERPLTAFRREIVETGLDKVLQVELTTRRPDGVGLAGSGLIIRNPPFGLPDALSRLLPALVERLTTGSGAGGSVDWLARERVR